MCTRVIQTEFVSCYCIFSYIVLIFHISRITQDKIIMPQPPHTHRNHPPITPHPKTVFLSDLSVCITDSSEGTPVALHNRFDELSTISEIHEIPTSPPPPPSNASPPHTPSKISTSSYTYTYVTDPRSPTSFPHSPEFITVTTHVHDHSYASLPHPPSKQTDAITKVNNWMNDGSVCSDSSSSSEAETAASAPAPATLRRCRSSFTYRAASTRYCLTNSSSHPFEHIHASRIFMPISSHLHRQHHYKTYTRGNRNQAATTISRGSLCANVTQARRPSACIGNSQRDQHHFETNKIGRGFLWERPLHTSGQQGRAAPALCKQSLSNNGIGKN